MSRLQPTVRTVGQIFGADEYVIPIYQRAYAWGREEIKTLLSDVRDYRARGASSYYIGSLVTHAESDSEAEATIYEVVDGQQRLTTLFVVLATLGETSSGLRDVLRYEGRHSSTRDLSLLAKRGQGCSVEHLRTLGIRTCVETVRSAWASGEFTADDLRYLRDHVKLVRTTLPAQTDLNHYFEVMNSRGEQLEKHEIVKASLLSTLNEADSDGKMSRTLALVWDACSDMSRHVAANFETARRTALFGSQWDSFLPESFDDVVEAMDISSAQALRPATNLGDVLSAAETDRPRDFPQERRGAPETDRFGAIIDFPNFLLHVLELSGRRPETFSWSESTVALDDKQLVTRFAEKVKEPDSTRQFLFDLLRIRWLFDKYVIKTDLSRGSDDDSNWVLQRVRKREGSLAPVSTFAQRGDEDSNTDDHEHIVMLQSMFQVTDSRRAYKNFLYATLQHLHANEPGDSAKDFVAFLQDLAAKRYLNIHRGNNLDLGTSVPHFAFNYLDYLLWRSLKTNEFGVAISPGPGGKRNYRFRYRTSVEHFYPQHPDPGGNIRTLERAAVDQFGNLCLMSRSENSQRSNLAPGAKIEQYRSEQQTLKFQIMAAIRKESGDWDEEQMAYHGRDMRELLERGSRAHATETATERPHQ